MSFHISKSCWVAIAVVASAFGTGCSGADAGGSSDVDAVPNLEAPTLTPRAAYYPGNQQPADPGMGKTVRIPAGKVVKFNYTYKGLKEQFAMIHNLTFDLPVATTGNYRVGPRSVDIVLPVQAVDIDYLITGYSKDCHYSSRCDRRAWAQEPGREIQVNTIGFEDSDEATGDYGDVVVTWSIYNP